jgi:hypothetical protein
MMDDSFSFEPVKLNAGSDPTKVRCNDALYAGVDGLTNSHICHHCHDFRLARRRRRRRAYWASDTETPMVMLLR